MTLGERNDNSSTDGVAAATGDERDAKSGASRLLINSAPRNAFLILTSAPLGNVVTPDLSEQICDSVSSCTPRQTLDNSFRSWLADKQGVCEGNLLSRAQIFLSLSHNRTKELGTGLSTSLFFTRSIISPRTARKCNSRETNQITSTKALCEPQFPRALINRAH